MTGDFDEDLAMYEEAKGPRRKQLDNRALLRPISVLPVPRNPVSVAPKTPVGEVLGVMTEKKMGAILVVERGKLAGIFTERDALLKGLYAGKGRERPVREFMTADPDCLTLEDPIALALNRMAVGGYRHVPLVDAARKPVGLLVMRDVIRYIVEYFPREVLNAPPHSEHAPPDRAVDGG